MIPGFEVTPADQLISELGRHRDTYHDRGKYLGWESMDKHYSMSLGNCTDWTGFPMSGKTQILMECLVNSSLYYGWKHLLFMPDVGNNIEILSDLIHKKTGKTFDPKEHNVITDEEITRAAVWMRGFFTILKKKDVKAKMTPFEFWDYAVELKNSEGLHTASIDSWKDLSHPYDKYGGYGPYLEVALPYRNQISEDHNLHLHTIIHPKTLTPERDKSGNIKPVTVFDLKGGSEWFNSGKCMITVHREDLTFNKAQVIFGKIKPRSVGKMGSIELFFDVSKGVYYEQFHQDGMSSLTRVYAAPKGEEKKELEQIIKVKMNGFLHSNFDEQVDLLFEEEDPTDSGINNQF